MRIFRSLSEIETSKKPLVVTMGNFDGVHRGHRKIINSALEIAKKINGEVLVFSFFPHPQMVLGKGVGLLNTFEQKTELIESLGVDKLLTIPFSKEIMNLSPIDFVKNILSKLLNAVHVVVGFNYSFGYKGQGKAIDLVDLTNKFGIKSTIIEPFYYEGELVSSTKIRNFLQDGNIEMASKLLSYNPSISGKVVSGNKLGRQMGFPTANILFNKDLLLPARGVYAVEAIIQNQVKKGVLNIGYRPTVSNENIVTVEVNILDFSKDLYGKDLKVIVKRRLRGEKKFTGIDELKMQIKSDIQNARNFLN